QLLHRRHVLVAGILVLAIPTLTILSLRRVGPLTVTARGVALLRRVAARVARVRRVIALRGIHPLTMLAAGIRIPRRVHAAAAIAVAASRYRDVQLLGKRHNLLVAGRVILDQSRRQALHLR